MDKTIEQLAEFASNLTYESLTPDAIHAVKRSVVDSIGCALGAFNEEPLQAARKLAMQMTAQRPATVIGTTIKTTPDLAALVNGAMIRYLDFSDDYFGGTADIGPHPSDNIGGVLAAVESTGSDGKAFVLGTALAYEVCGHLTDVSTVRQRGWDYTIFHSVATAVGAGKMLGLSQEQLGNAISLSIVPNISVIETRRGELSNWKSFAGPNGSRNGLFAALLAKEGITGPGAAFEGVAGYMNQLNNPFSFGSFGGDGTAFKVEGTFFKYMPVRYDVQLPIWIAYELRNKVNLQDIQAIRIYMVKRFVLSRAERPETWDPQTRETADHSLPYLVGAALVDGEITTRTFKPERYRDSSILGLIQKIEMAEDPVYTEAYPGTFNCRFEATLKSGDIVTVHQTNPKGHPMNPMCDNELSDKFMLNSERVMPKSQCRDLLNQLWNLEKLTNMQTIFSLMQSNASF